MPGYRKSKGGDYLTNFQLRIGARNDQGTWTYSPTWTTISNDWNGIEVEYLRGTNSGEMRLWVNGVLAQTLTVLDTDTIAIDAVQLGVMGVDSGTRGTLYLDDFTSTRFSTIGMLPDPGVHENLPIVHTYTSQPDGTAGVDTFINSSGSTSNYGTIDYMWVGYSSDTNGKYRSLIKFNLASIPANATITSATLILRLNYQGGTTANTMSVYPLLKNWTETGVTWNRYDGTNNWQTAGAGGATDRDTTSMGSRGFVASEPVGFKAIPLDVSTMQSYVNGTKTNYGWLLKMDTESGYLYEFTTSDRYIVANRPQLVVEYTLPEEEPDWINKAYTYEDEDHIHAVTSLVVTDENDNQTTNTYRYDANGNMTCRIEGGETFLQAYNAENRMSGVLLVSGDCDTLGDTFKAWQFTYDGDGVKVKQEYTDSNGTLTTYYFAGGSYEVQTDGITETVRQYYAIAGVTSGMREDSTFYYFLTDHLGSVVGVTDATGTLVSETRYLPFGEVRTDVGTVSQTDYGFTFQRNDNYIKLLDYRFRSYSPELGRFVSPDSIVPNLSNPQSLNRYSYVNNRPINFNDPSGHMMDVDDGGSCVGLLCLKQNLKIQKLIQTPTPKPTPTSTIVPTPAINAILPTQTLPIGPSFSQAQNGQSEIGPTCTNSHPCFESWEIPNSWDLNPKNPDYYSFSLNSAVFGISLTIDRYNDFYLTPTIGLGKALTGVTGSFMVGRFGIDGYNNEVLPNFLLSDQISGWGMNGTIGALGGLGFNKGVEANSQTAYEFGGLLVASFGLSVGYSWNVSQTIRELRR